MRSDLTTFSNIPANELQLSWPDPLESSILQNFPLDDLPLNTLKAEAGVIHSNAVRNKPLSNSKVRQVNQLVERARPFAQDMKLLKP